MLVAFKELLDHLEKSLAKNPFVEDIGKVFFELSDVFGRYSLYCSNHSVALEKLANMTQSSKSFKSFLEVNLLMVSI